MSDISEFYCPNIVYGFHGTTKEVADNILNKKDNFKPSKNNHDWLGNGIYFWEGNLERAEEWAQENKKGDRAVLGAMIDLGFCLDFLQPKFVKYMETSFEHYVKNNRSSTLLGVDEPEMPKNIRFGANDNYFKNRQLDCAVIRHLVQEAKEKVPPEPFDTVRCAFQEGEPVYDGAQIFKQTHIQIAVLNIESIRAVFLPH